MRSGNPSLKDEIFEKQGTSPDKMTLNGTVNKSFLLIILVMVAALVSWTLSNQGVDVKALAIGSAIVAFIVGLVTAFVPRYAPVTAPIYAILEGLFVGAISAAYENLYDGVTQQAMLLTFGVFCALLAAYKSGFIRASENFKLGVVAATGGIALMYLFNLVLGFFGLGIPFLHEASPVGILISVGIVIVAALNLVLDFDFIENGVSYGAPKYMEWYGAFGLVVTLVWLYLEILRLLGKIAGRD